MKHLLLKNASFRYLEQSFKEWLGTLGYAPITVYGMPTLAREFLHYLESINIKAMNAKHIRAYYAQLKQRSNTQHDGALSNSYLNKHIQAIRKFTDYLRQVGRLDLVASPLKNEEADTGPIAVLSVEEIELLFAATYKEATYICPEKVEHLQSRDRAMLAVYYGCGLRRNEGVNLDIGDIDFEKSLLHVRKGKNYKERFVPISKASLKYLRDYVYDHRPELLQDGKSEALFISLRFHRMRGQSLILRLKHMQSVTGDGVLNEKEIGLHTLRHSIATHLLQAGMKMESISRFLGHSSLASTQRYTHLLGLNYRRIQRFKNIPAHEYIRLHPDEL